MKKTSRLNTLRNKIESLTFDLQKFCLQPSLEKFTEICSCVSVRRNEEAGFASWRTACLYKYGEDWNLNADPEDERKAIQNVEFVFSIEDEKLCKKAIAEPTQSNAVKLIYIFFALGELKYIDLFYQCMGHEKLPMQTRQYLVGIYKNTREMYKLAVSDLLSKNPNHFDELGLTISTVDFSYFDNAKERAQEEKRQIEEKNNLLRSLAKEPMDEMSKIFAQKFGNRRDDFPVKIYGIN